MVHRTLNPLNLKSYFLFGARGTGKTTFLKDRYTEKEAVYIDLLNPQICDDFMMDYTRFDRLIESNENQNKIVIIDEVQKLPKILDRVHFHIEKSKRIFVLTGSSSRKLKQQGVNLLAGRAFVYHLFPFTFKEIENQKYDFVMLLEFGMLPESFLAKSREYAREYLNAYIFTYLEKEIMLEQWVRNLEPFRKFLAVAAQMNGKIINKSAIAREVGVNDTTINSYYEILEDTLIGIHLSSYHRSVRKSQTKASKFYFIDTGIKRAIEKTLIVPLVESTSAFGEAFEHWIILEIYKRANYLRLDWSFYYINTKDGVEIDLVIERPGRPLLLIEIKSKTKISEKDVKALETLGVDLDQNAERILVSRDEVTQNFKNSIAYHWKDFFEVIFQNK